MSQSKLTFRSTKHRQCKAKPLGAESEIAPAPQVPEPKKISVEESLKSKRKWVSSPDSPGPEKVAPPTGHTKSKRGKRARRQNIPPSSCKTLLHYMNAAEKDAKEPEEKKDEEKEVENEVEVVEKPAVEAEEAPVEAKPVEDKQTVEEVPSTAVEVEEAVATVETSNKSTQKPGVTKITAEVMVVSSHPSLDASLLTPTTTDSTSEFVLQKSLQRVNQEEVIEVKKPTKYVPKTSGGRMLAAALNNADGKRKTPAFKSDILKALAAKPGECSTNSRIVTHLPRHPKPVAKSEALASSNTPTEAVQRTEAKQPVRCRAKDRFAHLLQPPSPKLKPFQSITIASPTKASPSKSSPRKDVPPGLSLPESYKHLLDKFVAVDQVINIKIRRRESTTFQQLQKNVQEICRKRFSEDDLARIVGLYPPAYHLKQEKGLVQVKNDRMVRGGYQLTIAINLTDTQEIRKSKLVNTSALHPSLNNTVRKVNFNNEEESNIKKYNEEKEAQDAHDTALDNQRGLISCEMLERKRRFANHLLNHVRAEHQDFLKSLVPPLNINDNKLTRWHPEFDLNGLTLPAPGTLPESPDNKSVMSASAMLHSIDSNRAQPPPGLNEAVQQKIKEQEEVKKERKSLEGVDSGLMARIRAKEAKLIAEKLQRNPESDKQLAMLGRMDSLVRCMRVIYVSAGKGSMLFDEVCSDISDSSKFPITPHSVAEHIRLLVKVVPTWVSLHSIRKKEYLKVNRNTDINNVLNTLKSKETSLAN